MPIKGCNCMSSPRQVILMNRIGIAAILLFTCFSRSAMAQFTGQAGVYYLGSADVPIPASKYSNADISGAVCRFRWSSLEPSPGTFNWSFIDGEIAKAASAGKKISLQPLGAPEWLADTWARNVTITSTKIHSIPLTARSSPACSPGIPFTSAACAS